MDDKKFTVDDAADPFGEDEIEEVEPDPDPDQDFETESKMKLLISRTEEYSESEDMILDVKDKALEIIEKHKSIYKLTLQGMLEVVFPTVDRVTIRRAVNSLKDHPEVKWPHNMLLQKV